MCLETEGRLRRRDLQELGVLLCPDQVFYEPISAIYHFIKDTFHWEFLEYLSKQFTGKCVLNRELVDTIHLVKMVTSGLVFGPVSQPLLDPTVLLSNLQHGFLNLLIDPGHSNEPGGSDLQQSVNQGSLKSCFVCKPDRGSSKETEIDVNDLSSNMTEWQI